MWKVVVYKELRETLGLAALGLAGYVYLVAGCTGLQGVPAFPVGLFSSGQATIPFVADSFLPMLIPLSVILVIAVGLRQTIGESIHGTWLFLMHRPVARWRLIALKLATGMAICLGLMALSILIYAWWAATPGTHASPFEWALTATSWRAWLSMTPVYLGAFLVGLRPARWFGSRLLPLVGVGLLTSAIQLIPWWWYLGVAAIVLLDVWLVASILHVAGERDY